MITIQDSWRCALYSLVIIPNIPVIIYPFDYQNPETSYTSVVSEEGDKLDINTIIRTFLIFEVWILDVNDCSNNDQHCYLILVTFF